MTASSQMDSGEVLSSPEQLRSTLAREVVHAADGKHWHIEGLGRFEQLDVVSLRVKVQRPQHPVHDIRASEQLTLVFDADDAHMPRVLAARQDFPVVPHVFIPSGDEPVSLCLYLTPYEELKRTLTGRRFLIRISQWLSLTAQGKLHGPDQPLEAFLPPSSHSIVLPAALSHELTVLDTYEQEVNGQLITLTGKPNTFRHEGIPAFMETVLLRPTDHTALRELPSNLWELQCFLQGFDLDLLDLISRRIKEASKRPDLDRFRWYLRVVFHKSRPDSNLLESESRVFHVPQNFQEMALTLGYLITDDRLPDVVGLNVMPPESPQEAAKSLPVRIMNVIRPLTPDFAAQLNGLPSAATQRFLAVGVGALGSQVVNHLLRSGHHDWRLVDHDLFHPHNGSRHLLTAGTTPANKAEAVARFLQSNFMGQTQIQGFPENILFKPSEALQSALHESDVILDFSASVAVARHLSSRVETSARCISVFINPSGTDLVVLAEDQNRHIRLNELEMQYYQWVATSEDLKGHLEHTATMLRYATGCRDVSFQIPQEHVAQHSAIASRAIRQILNDPEASMSVWRLDANTGEVHKFTNPVQSFVSYKHEDWTLLLASSALAEMQKLRQQDLPSETGGVLLGGYDLFHKQVCITGVLPAPPDSEKHPTSFLRGSQNLPEILDDLKTRTLNHLDYLGEWHSHPEGCSTCPSEDDKILFSWLKEAMTTEGLPALMIIVGEQNPSLYFNGLEAAIPLEGRE